MIFKKILSILLSIILTSCPSSYFVLQEYKENITSTKVKTSGKPINGFKVSLDVIPDFLSIPVSSKEKNINQVMIDYCIENRFFSESKISYIWILPSAIFGVFGVIVSAGIIIGYNNSIGEIYNNLPKQFDTNVFININNTLYVNESGRIFFSCLNLFDLKGKEYKITKYGEPREVYKPMKKDEYGRLVNQSPVKEPEINQKYSRHEDSGNVEFKWKWNFPLQKDYTDFYNKNNEIQKINIYKFQYIFDRSSDSIKSAIMFFNKNIDRSYIVSINGNRIYKQKVVDEKNIKKSKQIQKKFLLGEFSDSSLELNKNFKIEKDDNSYKIQNKKKDEQYFVLFFEDSIKVYKNKIPNKFNSKDIYMELMPKGNELVLNYYINSDNISYSEKFVVEY